MKILLVFPPNAHIARSYRGWDIDPDDVGILPPTGLMYMAACLREKTGHEVTILDAVAQHMGPREIGEYACEYGPALIGVTAYTPTFYDVMETVKALRSSCPAAHICVGGPHAKHWAQETAMKPEVSSVIVGDGEAAFVSLAAALGSGGSLSAVPGLVMRGSGGIVRGGSPQFTEDLDSLPLPAYDLVPLRSYFSLNASEETVAVIFGSRGCPYKCTFCEKTTASYRQRSVEGILDEMEVYMREGIREFLFLDDLFNVTPQRVIDVSDGILQRGFHVKWTCRGRVDQVTDDMAAKAKEAGCTLISFGVEDCTNEGLAALKKGITTAQVLRAVGIAQRHGLETSTNWIVGLPRHKGEKDVMELLEFAKKVDSTYAHFMALIPYMGTELYAEGVSRGILKGDEWLSLVRNPKPDSLLPVWDEHLSREELGRLCRKCYLGYYLRPSYALKSLKRTRSIRQLLRKAAAALRLVSPRKN